jgi:hydroxyethylthiazole kinase
MELAKETLWNDIAAIRKQSPLVHNITNYVVMNNTANALLAVGASPVMAHAEEEVADMVKIAGALVVNIGTLSPAWVRAMKTAMQAAKQLQKPIILDPVGAGATPYRNRVLQELLQTATPAIIRGNASEIRALAAEENTTKGVDSTDASTAAIQAARYLHQQYGSVICVSGATDIIVSGDTMVHIHNGHPMMARVTGLGCTATAIIGAFAAIHPDYLRATVSATVLMGIAGELAAERAQGPGSLQMHLLDTLHSVGPEAISARVRLELLVNEQTVLSY